MSTDIRTAFPNFVPNQVLTDTQLNNLRDYLDGQNRLTRTRLTGAGIVCGFEASCIEEPPPKPSDPPTDAYRITLSPGFGITSAGHIIEIDAVSIFKYFIPFEGKDYDGDGMWDYELWQRANVPGSRPIYELKTDGTPPKVVKTGPAPPTPQPIKSEHLNERVLVLYLARKEIDLKSCFVSDCTNKGLEVQFELKALLVPSEILTGQPACDPHARRPLTIQRFHTELPEASGYACRLRSISLTEHIQKGYGYPALAGARELEPKLLAMLSEIQGVFGADSPDFLGISEIDAASIIKRLCTDTSEKVIFTRPATQYNQYHYDFIHDLICAYNEFLAAWCDIVKGCSRPSGYERHLMVRRLKSATDAHGATYRHAFEPSPVFDRADGRWTYVRALFLRMVYMIEAFDKPNVDTLGGLEKMWDIHLTPSLTAVHPIGKQALPFYYRVTADADGTPHPLVKYWQPDDCCPSTPLLSYRYQPKQVGHGHDYSSAMAEPIQQYPLDYSLQKHDLIRIEGHIAKHPWDVVTCLREMKAQHNLDFDIMVVYLRHPEQMEQAGRPTDSNVWDYQNVTLLQDAVLQHCGMEHCGGVTPGGTLVLVCDPRCPELDDDRVVADFMLPYRASCCTKEDLSTADGIVVPNPNQQRAQLVVDVCDEQEMILLGAVVRVYDSAGVLVAGPITAPETFKEGQPASRMLVIPNLTQGARYDICASKKGKSGWVLGAKAGFSDIPCKIKTTDNCLYVDVVHQGTRNHAVGTELKLLDAGNVLVPGYESIIVQLTDPSNPSSGRISICCLPPNRPYTLQWEDAQTNQPEAITINEPGNSGVYVIEVGQTPAGSGFSNAAGARRGGAPSSGSPGGGTFGTADPASMPGADFDARRTLRASGIKDIEGGVSRTLFNGATEFVASDSSIMETFRTDYDGLMRGAKSVYNNANTTAKRKGFYANYMEHVTLAYLDGLAQRSLSGLTDEDRQVLTEEFGALEAANLLSLIQQNWQANDFVGTASELVVSEILTLMS